MEAHYSNRLSKLERRQPQKRLSNREIREGEFAWEEIKRDARIFEQKSNNPFKGLQPIRITQSVYTQSLQGKLLRSTIEDLIPYDVVSPEDNNN